MIEVVVFPTPPFWLAIAMIFPIVIRCVRCWFGSVHVAKVRKKKCSTMFHGIFLRRMPSSSDFALHSRPTHRTRCQMQTAIRSLFHSHRTFPLARSPWLDSTQHALAASPFRPTDTAKNKPCFGRNSSTSRPILPTFHTPKPTSFVPLAPSHTRIRALHRFSTLPSPCRRNPFKALTNRLFQVNPSPFSPSHPNTDNSLTTNYLR